MDTTRRSSVRVTSAAFQRRLEPEPEAAVKKFFKIIYLSTIKEKKMKIPARFVRLGPKLSDKVTVGTPVGFKRSIGIKRIGDEVWFDDGWSEFAKAHSLSEGHFLLFHYTGNSSFGVMIFGVSASEIKYPLDQVDVIESDDDEVVEVMSGEEKEGLTRCESRVIDLEELLKEKPSVDDDDDDEEESDSMDEVDEDIRIWKG
uniref:B3 domain-containing protein n=1 Tax=Noccaea caerulescens TaxID=107243 RepID=A0A1J3E9W0_NOCCA